MVDGGTLFLDEVGDLSAELQPKLLRAFAEQEFERLGGGQTTRVNVRAAMHLWAVLLAGGDGVRLREP